MLTNLASRQLLPQLPTQHHQSKHSPLQAHHLASISTTLSILTPSTLLNRNHIPLLPQIPSHPLRLPPRIRNRQLSLLPLPHQILLIILLTLPLNQLPVKKVKYSCAVKKFHSSNALTSWNSFLFIASPAAASSVSSMSFLLRFSTRPDMKILPE